MSDWQMGQVDSNLRTMLVNREKQLQANFQLVHSGKLFPSFASENGYTSFISYRNKEVEALVYKEICLNWGLLKSGNHKLSMEIWSYVEWDDLSKIQGKQKIG